MSNIGEFSGVDYLRTALKFRKRKKNSFSLVHASSTKRETRHVHAPS